jgi:hypothetical protein
VKAQRAFAVLSLVYVIVIASGMTAYLALTHPTLDDSGRYVNTCARAHISSGGVVAVCQGRWSRELEIWIHASRLPTIWPRVALTDPSWIVRGLAGLLGIASWVPMGYLLIWIGGRVRRREIAVTT